MTNPLPKIVTDGLSPKVIVSTVLALALGVVVAVLNAVQAQPGLIAFLPPWAQFLVLAAVPTLLVGLGGYQAPAAGIVEQARGQHEVAS